MGSDDKCETLGLMIRASVQLYTHEAFLRESVGREN